MIGQAGADLTFRARILGVPIDCLSMEAVVAKIEEFIQSREPHIVVTADSSGIVQSQSDAEFAEILQNADIVTPDSEGVLWAAKRKGIYVPERVSGVDLFAELCQKSAEKGYRLFFLGAAPGVAEIAAERLRLRVPGCNIVGARHGYFPPDSDEIVAQEIAQTKPDVLFVAMGIPRQEKFIKRTQHILRCPVAIGVGGTLDVFSGKVRRAPRIIQSLKLEWLYRLMQNPKKMAKARNLPIFVKMVLRSRD